jgi:amino acid transporter
MTDREDLPEVNGYSRVSVLVSAVVGLAVAGLALFWAQGFRLGYESLYRVNPSVEGGGIGSDWVFGNTLPALDFLIALIHAADVIMGAFILVMVFIHWAAFQRLAGQMRDPGEDVSDAVAADGGSPAGGDQGGDSA